MPKGYWDFIVAIGLVAVSLGAVAVAWHWLEVNRPEFASDPPEEEIEPGYYPGGHACDPSAVGRFPNGKGAVETVACQESREQHRLQANDLIQQRRAANAAATAAYFSRFQTLLGIVGMGFGFLTFCAAVAAALYARRAAAATEAAVAVADRQTRPYLVFTGAKLDYSEDGEWYVPVLTVHLRNCGDMPATLRRLKFANFEPRFDDQQEWRAGWRTDGVGLIFADNTSIPIRNHMGGARIIDAPYIAFYCHIRYGYSGPEGEGDFEADPLWLVAVVKRDGNHSVVVDAVITECPIEDGYVMPNYPEIG
jgi:hypothetical protein